MGNAKDVSSQKPPGEPKRVIGIGASAGGLKAFRQLLENLPAHTGFAFVLIQHLQSGRKSLLRELLSKITRMPVHEITHGTRVEADQVYVIPRSANMIIAKDILLLSPRAESEVPYHPIDTFLCSLAEEKRDLAVGVILSGMGSDGTLGLEAIREGGGICVAEDRKSAEYDEMPSHAIGAGVVDFELTTVQIAQKLRLLARDPAKVRLEANSHKELLSRDKEAADLNVFDEILQLLGKGRRLQSVQA